MNCAQFSLLPTTEYMGHRGEDAKGRGRLPLCAPHTPAQDGGVCSITGHAGQGDREGHTQTPTGGPENTPEYTQLYTGKPPHPGPIPTLSPVLLSPCRQEDLYCFERATLGGCSARHPPPTPILAHLQDSWQAARGALPSARLLVLRVEEGVGDFILHLSPSPS